MRIIKKYRNQFYFSDVGNFVKEIDPEDNATEYGYDNLGRLIKVISLMGLSSSTTR
jgi:YD repeat-containing protein